MANFGGVNLDQEQINNANLIMAIGREMGASPRDISIALMTAMQESSMRNLTWGDRDSAGLFQQRPSQGWGTYQQVTDPNYSIRKFYSTLFTVGGRDGMARTAAAQAVQRSAYPNAYARWAGMADALVGGGGGGGPVTMAGAPLPPGQDPNNPANIRAKYGFVGQMAKVIPELGPILDQATREQWTTDRFLMTVANTNWWRSNPATVREWVQLEATDPAELQRRWDHAAGNVWYQAQQLGIGMSWEDARDAALFQIHAGSMSEQNFQSWLAKNYFNAYDQDWGVLNGEAAAVSNQITQMAWNWGDQDPRSHRDWLNRIMWGEATLDGYQTYLMNQAFVKYGHLHDQIARGMSLQEIAKPYREAMAETLELGNPNNIMFDDPTIQQALQSKDQNGNIGLMPVWKFREELRKDERWGRTDNAQAAMGEFITKLGRDWGFIGR